MAVSSATTTTPAPSANQASFSGLATPSSMESEPRAASNALRLTAVSPARTASAQLASEATFYRTTKTATNAAIFRTDVSNAAQPTHAASATNRLATSSTQ